MLYAVPLVKQIRAGGYKGKIDVEPTFQGETWILKLVYDGERPKGLPERWGGHQVVAQKAKPAGA